MQCTQNLHFEAKIRKLDRIFSSDNHHFCSRKNAERILHGRVKNDIGEFCGEYGYK